MKIFILRWLFLASLALPIICHASGSPDSDLSWISGCWVAPDESALEVWTEEEGGDFSAFGVAVSDNKVAFYEVLSIRQGNDGVFVYTATPAGQSPTSFLATEWSDKSIAFTNPDHDYPQRISYKRQGNRLLATISLLGGENPETFEKILCE